MSETTRIPVEGITPLPRRSDASVDVAVGKALLAAGYVPRAER